MFIFQVVIFFSSPCLLFIPLILSMLLLWSFCLCYSSLSLCSPIYFFSSCSFYVAFGPAVPRQRVLPGTMAMPALLTALHDHNLGIRYDFSVYLVLYISIYRCLTWPFYLSFFMCMREVLNCQFFIIVHIYKFDLLKNSSLLQAVYFSLFKMVWSWVCIFLYK